MRQARIALALLLFLLLALSCSRPSFTINEVHPAVSWVYHYDGQGEVEKSYQNLSLFVESEAEATLQMEILSPSKNESWIFPATEHLHNAQSYYGKANLSLGSRMSLGQGEWSVRLLREDGRTLTETFTLTGLREPTAVDVDLDREKQTLGIGEEVAEYTLQLLDDSGAVLYREDGVDRQVDLSKLSSRWEDVTLLGISWYDDGAKASVIHWYEL